MTNSEPSETDRPHGRPQRPGRPQGPGKQQEPDGPPASARPQRLGELPSTWRPLRELQDRLRDGIAEAYGTLGIEGVRPRFSSAVMFLEEGPLSIRELAQRCEVTHSAMSQSVAAMRDAGLVETEPGADARSRLVSLTARGREVAPTLWSEWYATESAVADVFEEVGASLVDLVAAMNAALDREPFADRVLRRMAP